MKKHSPFGGSQASRFMACPGSVALSERAPPEKASAYAEEGTLAHALAERCLLAGQRDALEHVGSTVAMETETGQSVKTVTEEMARAVNVYLEAVWEEFDADEASEIEVEQRFEIESIAAPGEVFGTNDALVYQGVRERLVIFDYKHGAGVLVDVEDNTQLKFYAMGALQAHPEWVVREIELVIVQPRAFNAGENGGVRRWSLPLVETLEFPFELEEAIKEARSPEPRIVHGDHCRWCPASVICTAREQAFLAAAGEEFAGVTLPDVAETLPAIEARDDFDLEKAAKIVAAYERLGPWINDLRQRMDDHLLAGGTITGWKVVQKVARAKWVEDEDAIASYLELAYGIEPEAIRPRKLTTITEAKRLLKAALPRADYKAAEDDLLLRFTIKDSEGLTTAPESDRRAAVSPIAAEFGSVQLGSPEGNDHE